MSTELLDRGLGAIAAVAAMLVLGLAGAPFVAQILGGAVAGIAVAAARGRSARPDHAARPGERTDDVVPRGAGRHVLERLPTPLVMIDRHGALMFANAPAHSLFGRLRLGEHHTLSFRHPDLLAAISDATATGAQREFDFVRPGDQARHLRAHVHAVEQAGDGDWPRVICLFEDRTLDRQAEQMRTDFIANASHELRTPLASIKGYIETLRGSARDDPAAREEFLGVMAAQAERMHRLVDDLLSLSRIEMSEHQPPETPLDLSDVVAEVASALAPVASSRGSEIVVETPSPGPTVLGDRDQLAQAFVNLLENAIKYGREGAPVRLASADPNPSYPGMAGVTVIDESDGIAREHLPRLTERFYRVSPKRSRDLGGTGLGLAIVKHIVHRHRGEFEVKSEVGAGSRFTIWLPVATARTEN